MKKTVFQILILLFFSILFINLRAQPSGYVGKRFFFGLGTNINYAIMQPNNRGRCAANVIDYGEGIGQLMAFSFINSAHMEYILGEKFSMGAKALYWETKFRLNPIDYYDMSNPQFINSYYPEHTDLGQVYTKGAGIYFKLYRLPYAPLGRYYKFSLTLLNSVSSVQNSAIPDSIKQIYGNDKAFNQFSISYSVGKQSIIYNRFILSSGVEIGTMFPQFLMERETSSNMEVMAGAKIFNAFLLSYSIGISFLP